MLHQRLDQIRSKLTDQDVQTLRMSVGIDFGSLQLIPEVFAAYEQRREQAAPHESRLQAL
jgi:hypothetical protein